MFVGDVEMNLRFLVMSIRDKGFRDAWPKTTKMYEELLKRIEKEGGWPADILLNQIETQRELRRERGSVVIRLNRTFKLKGKSSFDGGWTWTYKDRPPAPLSSKERQT